MDLPKTVNLKLALELAHLSKDAYSQNEYFKKGKKWPGPEGYTLETTFHSGHEDNHAPIGFVASKEDDVYISWCGTISFREWIEGSKFHQVECSYLTENIKVELRFHQLYTMDTMGQENDSPKNIILEFLKTKQIKGTLYITGHSLGSALAVLNALDIAMNTQHSNPVLYTFAGPRVGSPEFASIFNRVISDSWRIVNINDEVPKLPFEDAFGNHYKHVNNEFDITLGGKFPWDWVEDHLLINYINHLKKIQ